MPCPEMTVGPSVVVADGNSLTLVQVTHTRGPTPDRSGQDERLSEEAPLVVPPPSAHPGFAMDLVIDHVLDSAAMDSVGEASFCVTAAAREPSK